MIRFSRQLPSVELRPTWIAKTLCVDVAERIVTGISAGTDWRAREALNGKSRFHDPGVLIDATSHHEGVICPFGLPSPLPVYCDNSPLVFGKVIPAVRSITTSVCMTPRKLIELTSGI